MSNLNKSEFETYKSVDFEEPDNPALKNHYECQTKATRIQEAVFQIVYTPTVATILITAVIAIFYLLLFFGTETSIELRQEYIFNDILYF
ncbi:hypothetical protein HK096_009472 [Nowakowskiella sp. JEL0078]|nr:hypothetical protein HK096_009472 [Nowakowskiella sp. JEL0078]